MQKTAGQIGRHSVLSMSVAIKYMFTLNKSFYASVDLTQKEKISIVFKGLL